MKRLDKENQYAVILLDKIQEAIEEIGGEELEQGDNATKFFHALSNITPCKVYNTLTGEDLNILDFNHIANKLVIKFLKMKGQND